MSRQESAARTLAGLLYIGYAMLRVVLRLLFGRERRFYIMNELGLHYSRVHSIILQKYRMSTLPYIAGCMNHIFKGL
jgi:hypothetical protein